MGWEPLSPDPVTGFRGDDLPAYVANGLVGLRVREIPMLPGSAIVNGVVGVHVEEPVEAAVPIPYPLAVDMGIGETWLTEQPWLISDATQRYDFAAGELFSGFTFHVGEVALRAEVLTFASRSCCGIAFHSECLEAEDEPCFREKHGSGALTAEYSVESRRGKTVRLEQIAALIPSLVHHRPMDEAVRRLAKGAELGFDQLRDLNRESWRQLWQGRIVVDGGAPPVRLSRTACRCRAHVCNGGQRRMQRDMGRVRRAAVGDPVLWME